ncbi:hypothetical protein GLW08_20310 [Pontibacillus yanchengensis]|uniref:Uncharacterized protein n=2 Tax=Pontibacillus yanchengensis TaxID=462910 RepID=A0ACC7VMG1_9BACI|nr:hypothetical protein [Pontibacillus yanchengensis]MYL35449.1 hypothetical protein [Pontibacillus yanchengensis]MYL55649.1 hypothetical protein [Pontibacillus yanchengensis]
MSTVSEEAIVRLRDYEPAIYEKYENGIRVGQKKMKPSDLGLSMLNMLEDHEIIGHLLENHSLSEMFEEYFNHLKYAEGESYDYNAEVIKTLGLFLELLDENEDSQEMLGAILKTLSWYFDPTQLDEEAVTGLMRKFIHRISEFHQKDQIQNLFYSLLDKVNVLGENSDAFLTKVLQLALKRATFDDHETLIHQLFEVTANKSKKDWVVKTLSQYMEQERTCASPILPRNCFAYQEYRNGNKIVGIEVDKQRFDVKYHRHEFNEVGHPKLLFIFEVSGTKIRWAKVAAIKERFISGQTRLYHYPFANVSTNFSACWPELRDLEIKELSKVGSLPYVFLNSETNDHLFNGTNLGEKYHKLQNNDFNEDELEDTGLVLSDLLDINA